MRAVVASLLVCAVLAACAPGIGQSPTAGPGARFIAPYDAGVIFADTCLIRGTNFEDALEGLRVHNVTQNAQTGTYYHNTANLSVRVTRQQCSLVFASRQSVDETIKGLASGTASMIAPPPPGVSVSSSDAGGGVRMFRLGIKAPVALAGDA